MSFKFSKIVAKDVEYRPTTDKVFPQSSSLDAIRFDSINIGNQSVLVRNSDMSFLLNEIRLTKDLHESIVKDMFNSVHDSIDTSKLSDSQLHSLCLKRSMQSFADYQFVSDNLEDMRGNLVNSFEKAVEYAKSKQSKSNNSKSE